MLNIFHPSPGREIAGFTLIELLVTIAILSILLALAAPSYSQWIANTRVRTTAEAIQNGLMLAKAEAVRRNTKVQLALTAGEPIAANVASITASTAGTAWMARVFQPSGTYTSADFIQGRNSTEGSGSTTMVSASQSTFVFTGVGRLSPIPASTVNINVAGTGASRPLRITISSGGAIRMCDPGLSITTTTMGC